ncbi:MAG: hypothetical protein QXL69_02045 [Candidatus Bathyarchaeia archaeon]|nr:hypothetical protein [Candidatus Bathyarchaeota archaeon]
MKKTILITLLITIVITVQLPYIYLLWFKKTGREEIIYVKPTLQKSVDIDWFNPEKVRVRWFRFESTNEENEPELIVIKSGDNLTLWLRISHFNRSEFNLTKILNIQIWFFNIWSPNSTNWGSLWKINIYLNGQFDRSQMLGIPKDDSGTQLILNWDDERINRIGDVLRFDFKFESIIPVNGILVIKSLEIFVIAQSTP